MPWVDIRGIRNIVIHEYFLSGEPRNHLGDD
ncbi:MAG: hypothetical protein KME60_12115 [Cyanomargarita calcarea GSE-NOS-MK-12-04C]|uniref:DUF86 domain-containing protein n=1 Tax=Cyanomargarita calcarea GSE-NOS-MK-12-04C TaxID=2839659 RepID=A0A951QLH6_9CYAN|nr:hypothetical protein [Cyanomargarita calcarea GSE-NOS-MK-12-04C]